MMQELNYIRCGDYYIPDIRLPEENRPIGRWGRMHRDYIKEHKPIRFNDLCLSGELWTYLADLNEQAQSCHGAETIFRCCGATPPSIRRRCLLSRPSMRSSFLGAYVWAPARSR